jgi:hypothetical protein
MSVVYASRGCAYNFPMKLALRYLYNLHPSGHCYKTFYSGNLQSFHGNTIILCFKAMLH